MYWKERSVQCSTSFLSQWMDEDDRAPFLTQLVSWRHLLNSGSVPCGCRRVRVLALLLPVLPPLNRLGGGGCGGGRGLRSRLTNFRAAAVSNDVPPRRRFVWIYYKRARAGAEVNFSNVNSPILLEMGNFRSDRYPVFLPISSNQPNFVNRIFSFTSAIFVRIGILWD